MRSKSLTHPHGHVTGVLGRVLLCLGTVILLFVAYQLWGTGIAESHSQAILSKKLDHELKKAGVHCVFTPGASLQEVVDYIKANAPTRG